MASLTKRNGSNNWYFRRRIPKDIRRILAELPRNKRPRNWHTSDIWISLQTADRGLAKGKYPAIAEDVEKRMKLLREGPKDLTSKQLSALSGILYRAFAEGLEEDPVLSAARWRETAETNREAMQGRFGRASLMIGEKERRASSMEDRFGPIVDTLLRGLGEVVTDASRARLIERLAPDLTAASEKLARNADGDYTPDEYGKRFPEWTKLNEQGTDKRSLTRLAGEWYKDAIARHMSPRSAKRWRNAFLHFAITQGHDDPARVTEADLSEWVSTRLREGTAAKTLNDTHIAAIKAIFEWGIGHGYLKLNPVTRRTRVKGGKKVKVRQRSFTTNEAQAILKAALATTPGRRENPKTAAAKRWIPLLCAYSGARVMEMVQLRKEDIREAHGSWIIRLNPEAGSIKTKEFRDVPVHPHLIELGFVEFVKRASGGPLFCTNGSDGTISGSALGIYKRLRTFVRSIIHDPNVQPNHAWRYTFRVLAADARIDEGLIDWICGHAPVSQGRSYTESQAPRLINAMSQFPRYDLS